METEETQDPDALSAEQAMEFVDGLIAELKAEKDRGKHMMAVRTDPEYIKKWQDVAHHLSWHYYNLEGK